MMESPGSQHEIEKVEEFKFLFTRDIEFRQEPPSGLLKVERIL